MPIIVLIRKSDDYFMQVYNYKYIALLCVEKEVFLMSEDAIKGCLAHELCHLIDPTLSERETDRMVIERGLGKELLAFQKYHDSIYVKYDKSDGLTKKEIIRLIK